eukprot:4206272-Pyramimonas_sp.AAC.1
MEIGPVNDEDIGAWGAGAHVSSDCDESGNGWTWTVERQEQKAHALQEWRVWAHCQRLRRYQGRGRKTRWKRRTQLSRGLQSGTAGEYKGGSKEPVVTRWATSKGAANEIPQEVTRGAKAWAGKEARGDLC